MAMYDSTVLRLATHSRAISATLRVRERRDLQKPSKIVESSDQPFSLYFLLEI